MSLPLPASARRHSAGGNPASSSWSTGDVGSTDEDGARSLPSRGGHNGALTDKAYLTDRIKALQRSTPTAKQKWWRYCQMRGSADFDPNRHDAAFLQGFVDSFIGETGVESPANNIGKGMAKGKGDQWGGQAMASSGPSYGDRQYLVDRIKALQRSSPEAKQKWWRYCSMNGKNDFDPMRHDERFLQGFVDAYQNEQLAERQEGMTKGKGAMDMMGKGMMGKAAMDMMSKGGSDMWSQGSSWDNSWGKGQWGQGQGSAAMDFYGQGMMAAMMAGMGPCGNGMMGMSMGSNQSSDNDWKGQGLTTMGMNKGKSEFGILECPPAALVNRKRGAGAISMAAPAPTAGGGGGGLMTEEEAKAFQKSLKRSKS